MQKEIERLQQHQCLAEKDLVWYKQAYAQLKRESDDLKKITPTTVSFKKYLNT